MHVSEKDSAGGPKPADPKTDLALQRTGMAGFRTQLALDRTTLAWIRTTLTMASFRFGMVGFFRFCNCSRQPGCPFVCIRRQFNSDTRS